MKLEKVIDNRLAVGKILNENNFLEELRTHVLSNRLHQYKLNEKLFLNHLTPNRNMEEYEFSCNINYKIVVDYFDKITISQYEN